MPVVIAPLRPRRRHDMRTQIRDCETSFCSRRKKMTMMHDCAVAISNAGLIVISLVFAWRLHLVRDVGCSMEKVNFRIREFMYFTCIFKAIKMHVVNLLCIGNWPPCSPISTGW